MQHPSTVLSPGSFPPQNTQPAVPVQQQPSGRWNHRRDHETCANRTDSADSRSARTSSASHGSLHKLRVHLHGLRAFCGPIYIHLLLFPSCEHHVSIYLRGSKLTPPSFVARVRTSGRYCCRRRSRCPLCEKVGASCFEKKAFEILEGHTIVSFRDLFAAVVVFGFCVWLLFSCCCVLVRTCVMLAVCSGKVHHHGQVQPQARRQSRGQVVPSLPGL